MLLRIRVIFFINKFPVEEMKSEKDLMISAFLEHTLAMIVIFLSIVGIYSAKRNVFT